MNDKETLADYSLPVYRSLTVKKQLFGIGETAFFGILIITTILACMVSVYCIGLGVMALLVTKIICRKEPMLCDFLIDNICQSDRYRG